MSVQAPSAPAMIELTREPLAFDASRYLEVKDPCPVRLDSEWHLFGTAVTAPHTFELLHATAPRLAGPWCLRAPAALRGDLRGGCLAAPGMIADGSTLHMFLQTDYNALDGRIEHLLSIDGGASFRHEDTALVSLPGQEEAGVYDAHPAEVRGQRYLVYSAFAAVGEPDIHLARSSSGRWSGPWERLGPLLRHEDVPFHNSRGAESYEWGLEGAQLVEMPGGGVLLNAVCFLSGARAGERQRVFLGLAEEVEGPYALWGPAFTALEGDAGGENGHGTVVTDVDGTMALFLQERAGQDPHWRYALARMGRTA